MKSWLAVCMVAMATMMARTVQAQPDDKTLHVGFGYVTAAAGMALASDADASKQRALGMGVALAAGVGKELTDTRFDSGDLAADVFGALLATQATWRFSTGRSLQAVTLTGGESGKSRWLGAVFQVQF